MKNFVCVASIALLAVSALAQVQESTTVEVIQVPVYVTAHGASVPNLTRDNFRLFVNGKPQTIDYFDAIDFATLPGGAATDPRERRLYMLLFDLTFSPANALQRAQKAAEKMIDASAPTDTFGIATLTPADGAKVIVPFTRDRVALARAIRSLHQSRMPDPLHIAVTTAEREGIIAGVFRPTTEGLMASEENAMMAFESTFLREAIEDAIGELADLAARLAPIEGVKHIVLLSTGFDASLIHGVPRAIDYSAIGTPRARDNGNFSPMLIDDIRKMTNTFTSSSVFLDAIDIGGLRPMQRGFDNEALYTLTRNTGGQVVDHRNDLDGAMQALAQEQRVAYLLSFNAQKTGRALNKIAVKLVDAPRGSRAAYRESYASELDPPDTGDPLRLADIVINDIPQSGVTTTEQVTPQAGKATVNVEIAAGELGSQSGGMTLQGEALLYIFSGPNAVAFQRKEITIEPKAMQALSSTPVRLSQTFDLPPGQYAAKALIRFGLNGTMGFARADFTVPAEP